MDFQLGKKLFTSLYEHVDGYAISARARNRIAIPPKDYVYGEVIPESFYEMIRTVSPKKGEVFYDLGSGIGKAVILASIFFEFSKCVGIEILEDLYTSARDVSERLHNPNVKFINGNFLDVDVSDGDIFFVHSTCFPDDLIEQLAEKLKSVKKGTRIIMVTKTLDSPAFTEVGQKDQQMGWGKAIIRYYCRI